MSIIKALKITAKMYECRDAARRLYGTEWPEKRDRYQAYIRACMQMNHVDEFEAVVIISKECDNNAVAIMILMGALVELIEPE
jgi:hypothetical protein